MMNDLAIIGKKRTVLLSISILLVSIHTIYYYHSLKPEIEVNKLFQQLIRFMLTIGLLYFTYKGKNWAKIISIILFSIATIVSIVSVVIVNATLINKIPLFVMAIVYLLAVYHFAFSKSYKAFWSYQNGY